MRSRSFSIAAVFAALALGVQACGDQPLEPTLYDLEIVVAGGDAQYGLPGQRLGSPLQVLVKRTDTGAHQPDLKVEWSVEGGDATLVSAPTSTTDADGYAQAVVQLGSTPGAVQIRAAVQRQAGVSALFVVHLVDRPTLVSLSNQNVRGGDTLTMLGSGFSTVLEQNVVLFSGIRGRVVFADPATLRVEVPRCLPSRQVTVTAQLGALVSQGLSMAVEDAGEVLDLSPGIPMDIDDPTDFACVRLAGGGARYLVLALSAGTVGAAKYEHVLTGLSSSNVVASPASAPAAVFGSGGGLSPREGVAEAFEDELRSREAFFVRNRTRTLMGPDALSPAAAAVPAVGDKRTFKVLNAAGKFDDVTASVRRVGEQAVLYVDQRVPAASLTDQDLARFAAAFDDVIFPTDTAAFGAVSDRDANERVVMLFTPTVNGLTPRNSAGFVGGFFYGLDLLDREGSNRGEIFYLLVPDAGGQYSDPRSRDQVLAVTPAILAHELQHMIHFNERVVRLEADGTEALWLSEGMAQMAEELVARAYLARADFATADQYRAGNIIRARRFLANPAAVSLIVATGQGSLEERGAGWLYTLYLWDRWGRNDMLRRLTRTVKTGAENVEAATGAAWPEVLSDWSAALYLDGAGSRAYPFQYPSVLLRDLLHSSGGYPLVPEVLGSQDFSRTGWLWSSSAQHYIVIPPASGSVALRLGGEAGGNAPSDAVFRLRIVRLY